MRSDSEEIRVARKIFDGWCLTQAGKRWLAEDPPITQAVVNINTGVVELVPVNSPHLQVIEAAGH
jgi:hypothetical protein